MTHPHGHGPKMPELCPRCGSDLAGTHCSLPACTWIVCAACKGYGLADGGKWVERKEAA